MNSAHVFSPARPSHFLGSAAALLLLACPPLAQATGDWNTLNLLSDHQYAAISSPEFWFELEMKDLAKAFPVKEKHVKDLRTPDAELASFDEAVKAGKVDAASAATLRAELQKGRDSLPAAPHLEPEGDPATEPTPVDPASTDQPAKPAAPKPASELPSEEFGLYQAGAAAFHGGDYTAARAAWKALLALPSEKRHYRSVWAEFMLGRSGLVEQDPEAASVADSTLPHFKKVRELAAQGFPDPLGLAAASYGWEGYVWNSRDPEQASPENAIVAYLQQLASGDERAFTSIRFVLRDQFQLGHFEMAEANASAVEAAWQKAAASPVLRQVITRWHLAMDQDRNSRWAAERDASQPDPVGQWLARLEKTNPKAEEADRLAWLAYRNADYAQAQRWLKLAPAESRLTLWLTAKLALRAGDSAKAAALMDKVDALFPQPEKLRVSQGITGVPLPRAAARGEHAAMLLAQGKFQESLAGFLAAGHWQDAAYVAERVLTLPELQDYVAKHFPKPAKIEPTAYLQKILGRVVTVPEVEPTAEEKTAAAELKKSEESSEYVRYDTPKAVLEDAVIRGDMSPEDARVQDAIAWRLRWLLARRMVREDQEAAARPFLPRSMQPVLDAYVSALDKAKSPKTPKTEQARSWWTAAWIARHAGMELMGTELEPDSAWDDGAFGAISLAIERKTGLAIDQMDAEKEDRDSTAPPKLKEKLRFAIVPSAEEKKRLAKSALPREYRYHYRWVAASLAKKAATLLANGTEEKADVLNQAGSWLFGRDVNGEEQFFFEIKKTCPSTQIGRKVLETKHTAPMAGPWSGKPEEDE